MKQDVNVKRRKTGEFRSVPHESIRVKQTWREEERRTSERAHHLHGYVLRTASECSRSRSLKRWRKIYALTEEEWCTWGEQLSNIFIHFISFILGRKGFKAKRPDYVNLIFSRFLLVRFSTIYKDYTRICFLVWVKSIFSCCIFHSCVFVMVIAKYFSFILCLEH